MIRGLFGQKKLIFGQTGINNIIVDKNGEFGVSDNAISIFHE